MFKYSFSNNKVKSLDIVVYQGFLYFKMWAQLASGPSVKSRHGMSG